eukprot:Rmarinus@m.16787
MEIQNETLGEHKIRELNDEINKLIREKGHWEDRILELGGSDYKKAAETLKDANGEEIRKSRSGYLYFGAAKNLPGVKRVFQDEATTQKKRTRGELMKNIDADYYGYRDEEDGVLLLEEAETELKIRDKMVKEHRKREEEADRVSAGKRQRITDDDAGLTLSEDLIPLASKPTFKAHTVLPNQQEIEKAILQKRKKALLEKYLDDPSLQPNQPEVDM